MRRSRVLLGLLAGTLLCACSGSKSDKGGVPAGDEAARNTGGDTDPGEEAPYASLSWSFVDVDVDDPELAAGIQGKLLRAEDGTLYYAYLKFFESIATCDIQVFGDSGPAPGVNYQLKLAIRPAESTAWELPEVVPLENVPATNNVAFVSARFGVDGAFDASGNPVFAFAAGGAGRAQCGSSDLVQAVRQQSGDWDFHVRATQSSDCCGGECPDPACEEGTDVGAWAAVARDGNAMAIAYVDYHFFWDKDGNSYQGYEMWHETDGTFGIKPWSGLGNFGSLVSVGGTLVSVFAGFSVLGLYALRRTDTAGSVSDWEETNIRFGAKIGERIASAVAPDGVTVGVAFHEIIDGYGDTVHDLIYCESPDGGTTWEPCESVDEPFLNLGRYPSLAFDNQGRPLISYRFCGSGTGCSASSDGLRLAWRELDGTWRTINVVDDDSTSEGIYSQLVLDPETNAPTILFQDETRGAAVAAQGTFPGGGG